MRAADIIQELLSLYEQPSYLEIGVETGSTFLPMRARRKVAVDPVFRFNVAEASRQQPHAEFHQVPSDEYFGRIIRPEDRFDLIYLDGLHTLEQTLRDFVNALHFVKPHGLLLIDDVVPTSWAASLPSKDLAYRMKTLTNAWGDERRWMGDVYRLVYFIDTFAQQWTFRIVAENHGQLVAWRTPRASTPDRRLEAVSRMNYEDVLGQIEVFQIRPWAMVRAEVEAYLAGVRGGEPQLAASLSG
jgi:hypothetical protein